MSAIIKTDITSSTASTLKNRGQVITITTLLEFSQPYINKIVKKMRDNEL
jgi:hypothetical protein